MGAPTGTDETVPLTLTRGELNLLIRGLAEGLQSTIPEPERQDIRALIQKIRSQTGVPKQESETKDADAT